VSCTCAEFTKLAVLKQIGIVSKLFLICLAQVLSFSCLLLFVASHLCWRNWQMLYYSVFGCRKSNLCKIWSWIKLHSCGIDGSQPPDIWLAWGWSSIGIIMKLRTWKVEPMDFCSCCHSFYWGRVQQNDRTKSLLMWCQHLMQFSGLEYALAQGGCPGIEELKFDQLLPVFLYLLYHWNFQKKMLIYTVRCCVLGHTW
jgi:hypothetical protein